MLQPAYSRGFLQKMTDNEAEGSHWPEAADWPLPLRWWCVWTCRGPRSSPPPLLQINMSPHRPTGRSAQTTYSFTPRQTNSQLNNQLLTPCHKTLLNFDVAGSNESLFEAWSGAEGQALHRINSSACFVLTAGRAKATTELYVQVRGCVLDRQKYQVWNMKSLPSLKSCTVSQDKPKLKAEKYTNIFY